MGKLERLTLGWQELRSAGRVLRAVPKMAPNAKWSAAALLDERVRTTPDRPALLFLERRYSWRELDNEVNRYAHALRAAGVQAGDGVPLLMDNRPEFLFAMTAISRLGAIAALINTGVSGQALAHAIRVSDPKKMIVGTEHAAKLRAMLDEQSDFDSLQENDILEQRDDESPRGAGFLSLDERIGAQPEGRPKNLPEPRSGDCGHYIYTSGTTGLPKAAIIGNGRFILAGAVFARVMADVKPDDVLYMTLPLYHSTGMFAGWSVVLQSGACMALRRKFSASQFSDDLEKYGATLFIYIGELCRYLLNQPVRPSEKRHRLRLAMGNGLRPDIWDEFQDRYAIPRICEFYGATEGNAVLVNITGERGKIGRLRAGLAVLRCDAETGEVLRNAEGRCESVAEGETGLLVGRITSLLRFDGYVDRTASDKKVLKDVFTAGDRYFNTGDLIGVGENGWLSFVDRVGDTFRWKGENVSTNEVAEILNGAPGVLESNVYGVQVPGADGRAGMASLNCDESFSVDDFASYVQEQLPVFQRPYFVRLQHGMRITGTFKHQKVDYRREGFDVGQVEDPLYLLEGGKYVPLDAALHDAIVSGEKILR